MIDWSGCPLVTRREGYIGGKPALRDDPRVPPEIIVDNMDDGDTAEDVIEAYELRTPATDVRAIYEFAVRQRALVLPQP
jgi:uncharacterized protein (DUF433 family)